MRAAAVLLIALAACGSKDTEPAPKPNPGPGLASDAAPAPALSDEQKLYEQLLDRLGSPCRDPHSLRKSMQPESGCVRGPFAARYVQRLVAAGGDEDQIRLLYENKYTYRKQGTFTLGDAPHFGEAGAPLQVVEFLDYACPFCRQMSPALKKLVASYGDKAVLYIKMAPIVNLHPRSHEAAQAALAAWKQGKYAEMHDHLFADPPQHDPNDMRAYADSIGLDLHRYDADYAAAGARVDADLAEADAAEISKTPTLFINGAMYTDAPNEMLLRMWIDEELAVISAAGSP